MRNKKRNDFIVASRIESIINSIPDNTFSVMGYTVRPYIRNEAPAQYSVTRSYGSD